MHVKKALGDLKQGLMSHYPPCCVLQYCLDTLTETNLIYPKQLNRYIRAVEHTPCSLCMAAHRQTKEQARSQLIEDASIELPSL